MQSEPGRTTSISRRRSVIGVVILVAVLLTSTAACGDDGGAASEPTPEGSAAAPESDFPRSIEHLGGTVELDTPPTGVMTMRSFYDLDAVLALDVVPTLVGTYPGREFRAWQLDAGVEDAEMIDMTGGVNLEQVADAGIDLFIANEIVYTAFPEETDAVEQVGPLVGLPDFDFERQLRIVGDSLGVDPALVQQRIDEIEATLDGFEIDDPPTSIGVLNYYGDGTSFATTAESNTSYLLERIGLPTLTAPEPPADQARKDYVELSLELLPDVMDVDVLYGFEFDGGAEAWDDLEANPVFQAIPAVQNGRYYRIGPDEATALSAPSVLSVPVALDALVRTLGS